MCAGGFNPSDPPPDKYSPGSGSGSKAVAVTDVRYSSNDRFNLRLDDSWQTDRLLAAITAGLCAGRRRKMKLGGTDVTRTDEQLETTAIADEDKSQSNTHIETSQIGLRSLVYVNARPSRRDTGSAKFTDNIHFPVFAASCSKIGSKAPDTLEILLSLSKLDFRKKTFLV